MQPTKMTKHEAQKIIRKLAEQSENVVITPHASKQMRKRGITFEEVLRVIRNGTVYDDPYISDRGHWRINVMSRASGEDVEVPIALEWPSTLVIVTGF